MALQPTINDYLASLRVPLNKAVERARRIFEGKLNEASRSGQTGNAIQQVLDEFQREFERSVATALTNLKPATETTNLDGSELRQVTGQELENFARQLKSIVQVDRFGQLGSPQVAAIESGLAELDEHLRFVLRQFDVGLLNVGNTAPQAGTAPVGIRSTPSHSVILPAEQNLRSSLLMTVNRVPQSASATSRPIEQKLMEQPADIRDAARALSVAFGDQIEALKQSKSGINDPDRLAQWDDLIAFFEMMADGLANLAETLDRVVNASTEALQGGRDRRAAALGANRMAQRT